MNSTNIIAKWIDDNSEQLISIADSLHKNPELAYEEYKSSRLLADYLATQGFKVKMGTADIETAFTAEWGSGAPIIGFLAEYDALPGLGHACAHNLLGTAVCAAAVALKEDMTACGAPGTIRVYGTPAEEIMSGKIVMNDKGVFDDLDVAVTWHPFDRNRVCNDIWPSIDKKTYTFTGVPAHASECPELGRSALDAAELMNVGVNYLREHVSTDVRMHYSYENNGIPANIVPDRAATEYFIRSPLRSLTEDASLRVDNCARGAAMMTGTTVDIKLLAYCDEMKINRPLCELYYEAMKNIPTPEYTDEEYAYAEKLSKEAEISNGGKYFTGLCELEDEPQIIYIGTDASQVSHTVPLITLSAQTMITGTAIHHWANERQAGMSIGWKGMLYAARCMAEGTKMLMETPGAIEKAWEYHKVQ